ncbi:HEAT repeat domain-containing protein [Gaoshiqia sp. Z1-71]|uniref:HEAT repeat domain-containing protein n=1 Tax=Gaoshiqia hydrogeniformans TaxID=3290090 RepID=UPI003BF8496D
MKGKKLLYTTVFFLLSQIMLCGQSQPDAIRVEATPNTAAMENVREDADQASQPQSGSRAERYIERKESHIPHRSYWGKLNDKLYQTVMTTSSKYLSPERHETVTYITNVIFDVPVLLLLITLSLIFSINILIITIVLFITSFYKRGHEAYRKKMNEQLEQLLTDYLFYNADPDEVIKKLKNTRGIIGKNILIDILINFQRNLSGEYRDRILELYQKLGLYKVSEKRISSPYTFKRIRGIRELANMYPNGAKELIAKYVKDKNSEVRGEAQIAFAYLDQAATFNFLDDLNGPLSKWVQLNILNHVKLHEREVPSFEEWVESNNNDVQDFSIRMINYFQQNESAGSLAKNLDHPNEQTRVYVYQAIRSLNLIGMKDEMKKRYEEETYRIKIEILKTIELIGDEKDFDFLAEIVREDDIRLKLQACRALYKIGESGKAFLKELTESEDLNLNKFVEHIKDPRN